MAGKDGENLGRYEGAVRVEWLSDGRLVRLLEPFSFVDAFTMRWDVPSGWKVDGASIPQVLWSLVGSPFTGLYRDASVIHDYYCDTKSRPWGAVHRVFYDAMLASGVGKLRAKVMYAGVCWGGPRWREQQTSHYETALRDYLHDSRTTSNRVHQPILHDDERSIRRFASVETVAYQYPLAQADLDFLEQQLGSADVAAGDIPDFVEEKIQQLNLSPLYTRPAKSG